MAESVDEINMLDKSAIEKEVQELESQNSEEHKEELVIARKKN